MATIEINSITGLSSPYNVYICDVFGSQCELIATINTNTQTPTTFVVPPNFTYAPSVGVKLVSHDCVKFEVVICNAYGEFLIYQNGDYIKLQDGSGLLTLQ